MSFWAKNILSVIQLNFEDHTYTFTQRVCNLTSLNMCVASLKCIKNMPAVYQLDIHIIPRYFNCIEKLFHSFILSMFDLTSRLAKPRFVSIFRVRQVLDGLYSNLFVRIHFWFLIQFL